MNLVYYLGCVMKLIRTEQEFLDCSNTNLVVLSAEYASELYDKTKAEELADTGKNVILESNSISSIKKLLKRATKQKGGGGVVGRPRIEVADPSLLEGRELLRYKNRIWKRQSRERLKRN